MDYSIQTIINEEDRLELLQLYEKTPSELCHQDYNLFHCERRNLKFRKPDLSESPAIKKHMDWVLHNEKIDAKLVASYFVKYTPGSFVRMHHDNGTTRTIVTLVDTKGLVGGDTLFHKVYKKRGRKGNHIARRSKKEKESPPYGKEIIPKVARLVDGQSVIYGPHVKHGVSEVEQGHRIVLVTWYVAK